MQVVLHWLVDKPDVTLVAGATPIVVGPILPAIEDRLVLTLVIGGASGDSGDTIVFAGKFSSPPVTTVITLG
jgi:hypothetical protein